LVKPNTPGVVSRVSDAPINVVIRVGARIMESYGIFDPGLKDGVRSIERHFNPVPTLR
jgi:hypothetical protein